MSSPSTQRPASGRFRPLLGFARPYRVGWLWIASLGLLSGLLALAQPWPIKVVIDQVLLQQEPSGAVAWLMEKLPGASSRGGLLSWAAIASVVILVSTSVIEFRMAVGWVRVGQRMVYDVARALFARMQQRSLAFHSRAAIGDLLSRITTDSFCVYRLVETLLIGPTKALLLAALTVTIMAQMNLRLTLVAVLMAPLMGAAVALLGRRVKSASRAKREIESRIQAHVRQTLSGVQVVQAFGQEHREYERFHDHADAAIRAHQRTVLLGNVSNLWTGLIVAGGTGLILLLGSRLVAGGSLSIGGLLVFLAYLTTLQTHFQSLARTVTSVNSIRGEIDRVMDILEQEPEVREKATAIDLPRAHGHVRLEEVSFGYDAGRPVLQGINLDVSPGETIAVVGATGAGKTTLVSLVPRFHDPQSGRVLLDGHDLRDLSLRAVRHNVGVVFQEPYLTSGTAWENIAYGAHGVSDEQVVAAARAANAHEFITALSQGYDTVLGERGMTLSGGQRQRLSIARAFLRDAPVLILDEPTSALDARSEQLLVEALQRLMRDRTTFIIAHRLSTIRHADRIVVLDAGRIVEQGTHEALLARGGAYAKMHAVQFATRTTTENPSVS